MHFFQVLTVSYRQHSALSIERFLIRAFCKCLKYSSRRHFLERLQKSEVTPVNFFFFLLLLFGGEETLAGQKRHVALCRWPLSPALYPHPRGEPRPRLRPRRFPRRLRTCAAEAAWPWGGWRRGASPCAPPPSFSPGGLRAAPGAGLGGAGRLLREETPPAAGAHPTSRCSGNFCPACRRVPVPSSPSSPPSPLFSPTPPRHCGRKVCRGEMLPTGRADPSPGRVSPGAG